MAFLNARWGNVLLGEMRKDKLIRRLDGIGCNTAKNGPVVWPQYSIRDALALEEEHEGCSGSVYG